jgi:hypothetical protein
VNSAAAGNLSSEPQPQPPLQDEAGAEQSLCTLILSLLDRVSKDNPAGGEAEAQDPAEKSLGLQFLSSELYKGWVQIVQEMTESDESSILQTFADSVLQVAGELGSYIDAKKQFSVASSKTEEYTLLTSATDDLHERRKILLQHIALLHKQCRGGVLRQTIGNASKQQRQVRGQ